MSGAKGATYVYVCSTRYGSKIGVSRNVHKRSTELPSGSLVRYWHRPKDAVLVEYNAIRLVGTKAVKGWEWFDVPPERAIEAVEKAIEMVDAGTATHSNRQTIMARQRLRDEQCRASASAWTAEMRRLEAEGWYWDDAEKKFKQKMKQ